MIKHLHGVCHTYIDDQADIDKATKVAFNAKTQRFGTCNTMETLLVAEGIAERVLPLLGQMYHDAGVELRGCERSRQILNDINAAQASDWEEEYLAPILSLRVVADLDAAIERMKGLEPEVSRRTTFYGSDEIGYRDPCGTLVVLAHFPEAK